MLQFNMNDEAQWFKNPMLLQFIGAFLAIIGGYFAVRIRLNAERKQEVKVIKISLCDELDEIIAIIDKLLESARVSHIIHNDYLNDLKNTTEAFDFHRQKFYIFKDDSLRKDILKFYRGLVKSINESLNVSGTLQQNPPTNSDSTIQTFRNHKTEACSLRTHLHKYKGRWYHKII